MLNFLKFIFNPDLFTFYFGGGGGPTTTKSETSNIPEYARPYVERMMGATEKQVYTYGPKGNITGFQPFTSYSEFDKARGGAGETVAGFTPMQAKAMQGIGNYQLPGQTGTATDLTGLGILGSMSAGADYASQATDPSAMQSYMSPYTDLALQPQMREAARQSAIEGQRQQAQAVQAGAFGGSRQGLVEAERQRNLAQQQQDIYGKGMQTAFEQARQAQQFGADLGMRGYGQALQGAGQLGALGEQQYKQELGLLGQQMGVGEKQQQYEQNRLNQLIQDYATKQQYPFIQLGTLSNMLRGLPMQASTTQLYQAQPSMLQQGIGMAGAYGSLKQAGVNLPFKEGGEVEEMASGGIASGVDPYKLPGMMKKLSDDQLKDKMGGDTDPETMGIAQAEKQRRDQVRGMAGGGVVAFAKGGIDTVDKPFEKAAEEEKKKEAPPVATRPKAAAPKPVAETSPYQAEFKRIAAEPNKGLEDLKALQASYKTEADVGVEGQMERDQRLRDKYGIDLSAMYQNEKVEQKKALEEARGDARKAEYLRWAQMWAKFGSTPGPVLKAALTAINETVPDLLDDQTRARALQRSLKKEIYELDKAELLEKEGRFKEAKKTDQEAKGRIAALTLEVGKLQANEFEARYKAGAQLAGVELGGQYDVQKARIQASAKGGGEGALELKENKAINDALEKFDKRNQPLVVDLENKIMVLPEGHDIRKKAETRLKQIDAERKELETRLTAQMKRGTVSAGGETPKAGTASQLMPGQVVDGYRFKGGNPNDKNNWVKD
jgi:hypothetical protein